MSLSATATLTSLSTCHPVCAPPATGEVATFVAGIISDYSLRDAIGVTLATRPAAAGTSVPSPAETAAIAAQSELRRSLGEFLDVVPAHLLVDAVKRCGEMATTPHWTGEGQSGAVLRAVIDEHAKKAAPVPDKPPEPVKPAAEKPAAEKPDTETPPDSETERLQKELVVMQRRIEASKKGLERALVPDTESLTGMQIITPQLSATAGTSDVDIWLAAGSIGIIRRIAGALDVPYIIDPTDDLNSLTGLAGPAIAARATSDLELLREQTLAHIAGRPAEEHARFLESCVFKAPPENFAQSVARMLALVRAASDVRALRSLPGLSGGAPPPGGGSAQTNPKPPTGSGAVPLAVSAKPTKLERAHAVDSLVLAPLANPASVWKGHMASSRRSNDPIAESRRLLDLFGGDSPIARTAVSAFSLSNLRVIPALTGEIAVDVNWAAMGLHHHVHVTVSDFVGDCRLETASGATALEVSELVSGITCLDISFSQAVRLLGGTKPVQLWGAGRSGTRQVGRWGATTGLSASSDIFTAMRRLGRILIQLVCDALGGKKPVDDSLGLSQMAEAAELCGDALRVALFEEFFSRLRTMGSAHRRGGPLPDIEALALSCITDSLGPRLAMQDAEEAGRRSAEAEVKRLRPSKPGGNGGGGADGVISPGGDKLSRGQKRKLKKEEAEKLKSGADTVDASPANGSPLKKSDKRPDLDLDSVDAGAIDRFSTDPNGKSLMNYFEAAHRKKFPDRKYTEQPCPMMAFHNACDKKDCKRCAAKQEPDPEICSALKAAGSEDCLKRLHADSVIAKAA